MEETVFSDEYLRENFIRLNNVKFGRDVKIFSFVNAYGCEIGEARLHFNHSYGFDDGGGAFYDGGVIEYSTNGGSSWTSLNSRNIGSAAYGGVIDYRFNNPLG